MTTTTSEQIDYSGCYTLDDHLAEWWETTAWDEVLTGWTLAGRDECGCDTWTRPHPAGESVTPKSLTAHDRGCSRPRTDPRHPAAHVWSDHVDDDLLDMTQRFGRTLSAFAVFTALQHAGDFAEACRAVGMPSSCAQDLTELGTNFDDAELWEDPLLGDLADLADYIGVNRYAVVDLTLATVGAHVSPAVVMAGGTLGEGSLNTLTVLLAVSGVGKSSTMKRIDGLVVNRPLSTGNQWQGTPLLLTPYVTGAQWTGEGMQRDLRPDVDEETGEVTGLKSVVHRQDEVSVMLAKGRADGSTIIGVMNKVVMGEGAGSSRASAKDSYDLAPHSYRETIQLAGQPGVVAPLFTGEALETGNTGRMIVVELAVDDDVLDEYDRREAVGELGDVDLTTPRVTLDAGALQSVVTELPTGRYAYPTDPDIVRMLDRQKRRRNSRSALKARQASATGAAEGHLGLLQRKYATLLAIAKGCEPVGWEHWHLAGALIRESMRVQAEWRAETAEVEHDRKVEAEAGRRQVEREARNRDPEQLAEKVVKWYLRKYPAGETVKWSLTYRSPLKADACKPYRDEVRDLLAGGFDERVTVVETTKGYEIGPA